MRTSFYLIFIRFLYASVSLYAQCNGHESLCSKSYNEVAYLTTHNAYSSFEDGFDLPNQNLNITSQLNHGVRAFMLDVYSEDHELLLYHSTSVLGSSLLLDVLDEFKTFVDAHPNEVLTLILEDYSLFSDLSDAIASSGIFEHLFVYDEQNGWPTLQEMIDLNKRIVLFSDQEVENSPSWFHYIWEHAVETHYSNASINDFSCDYNRGDAQNDLFILNHFITDILLVLTNVALYNEQVLEVNSNPFFSNRVSSCEEEYSKFPNFITVDFFDIGNCLEVVHMLNDVPNLALYKTHFSPIIYPNPSRGFVHVKNIPSLTYFRITNLQGEQVLVDIGVERSNHDFTLNLSSLDRGFYFLHFAGDVSPIILID